MTDLRRHAPATLRNRDAIGAVLGRVLPERGLVLEIASGSGEHAVHFAGRFPALDWQPSDPDAAARASIAAWAETAGLANLRPPLDIAADGAWPIDRADALVCINMAHISPWSATAGLMRGAGRLLPPAAPLLLYGPFREGTKPLAPGNAAFDADLRARDARWGLREVAAVAACAAGHGLALIETVAMPANNLTLVFRRAG